MQYYYANVKQNPRLPPPLSRLYRAGDAWNSVAAQATAPYERDGQNSAVSNGGGGGGAAGAGGNDFRSIFSAPNSKPSTAQLDGGAGMSFSGGDWNGIVATSQDGPAGKAAPQPIGSVPGSPVSMRVRTTKSLVDVMGESNWRTSWQD